MAELISKANEQEAFRCLDCGVPFCQAGVLFEGKRLGCPLHNLIPEWNEAMRSGNREQALSRLLKTNPFPEFTGRVCAAFCQGGCLRRQLGERPVGIKAIELDIIESAFAEGRMKPRPPEVRSGRTVAIIGAGPAGLSAAYHLNRRGHLVSVFERSEEPGGGLMYGVSEKLLPREIVRRRIRLMEEEGVIFRCGEEIKDAESLNADFDAVISCTGREGAERSFAVIAISEGRSKAAKAERLLMGYTNIE